MSVFVSHDGDGTEVYVATAKAKVTRIEEKGNAVNAIVESSYLDYPLNGWLNKDEPIYEILLKAKESGEEIEVRIESQRKPGTDRSTPIKELRENNANKNIIKKLVGVNGIFTGEALTNPDDDPATGRPSSALHNPRPKSQTSGESVAGASKDTILAVLKTHVTNREISQGVVDALKAQALLQGATAAEIIEATTLDPEKVPDTVQNGYSSEAPAFKEYNSDGRLNLGGPSVTAGVGVYNYVHENLAKQTQTTPKDSTVSFLASLMLAIADRIQVSTYGEGFRVDRSAGSHTRIRSVLYSMNPKFPVQNGEVADYETVNAWVQLVGKSARSIFLESVKISQQTPGVSEILNDLKNSDAATRLNENRPNVTVVETTPIQQEAVAVQEPVRQEEDAVSEPTPQADEPVTGPVSSQEPPVASDADVMLFEQDLLPPGAITSGNAPEEELLDEFKNFVIEEVGLKTKSEQAQVSKLMAYTFGKAYNKAQNIPADKLGDFLDFYVMAGTENFRKALSKFA